MENKQPVPWGCIFIWIPLMLMGACTFAVANSEPEPYRAPNFGPSCVVTSSNGCTWAGQKIPKGSASDMIREQKRTKTGLYAED